MDYRVINKFHVVQINTTFYLEDSYLRETDYIMNTNGGNYSDLLIEKIRENSLEDSIKTVRVYTYKMKKYITELHN
jgi:hypothetical protein